MIRPFTCVCLLLAAGSGLYLYQVKQRAFALDADLRATFHGIDQARDRTRMLRADWALMNDPERLQALATQYLSLKPMGPSQLMTLDQLAAALPPPGAPQPGQPATPPGLTIPGSSEGMPMASATPPALPADAQAAPRLAMAPPIAVPALDASAPGQTDDQTADALPVPPDARPAPPAAPPRAPLLAMAPPALAPDAVAPPASAPPASASTPATATRHVVARPRLAVRRAPPADEVADGAEILPAVAKPRHHQKPAPFVRTPGQLYAANEPSPMRQPMMSAPQPVRITPPAATVMYRAPSAGSSLGMAAANLAPPRPLYSAQ
jgi:hypothetical protein